MASKSLTRAAVEALAYRVGGPQKQILWDTKLRGFGCRATPQGGKQYVILYRVSGRQRLMSLGRIEDFPTVEAARTKASRSLLELRDGGLDPMAARERMADAQSMEALWEVYKDKHLARLSVNTQRAVKSTWKVHLALTIGKLTPGQVTKADVIRVHDAATVCGEVIANRAVQRLKAMLTWLNERNEKQFPLGWKNPAFKFKLHRETERTAILDLAQQHALVASLEEEPDIYCRVYLKLLLLTGCRSNELLALTWANVNFDKATALIERSCATTDERKNGDDLMLPLAPVTIELLRSLPVIGGSAYVFPSPRKPAQPYTSNAMRRRYSDALDRAHLPHRTLHDLRRSLGTNFARGGASTKQIARLLGNTDEVTARVYIQLAADDLRQLTERNATALLPAPQS
jgi:integrase